MNVFIRKNTDQNNTIRRRRAINARLARELVCSADLESEDDEDLSDDDEEDGFPSPELLTQMSLNSLRVRQEELKREVVKAKERATAALGFAALALFALGFTLLSTAVRGLFH